MWLALSIKKAGEYMRRIGASFLFTGEVLGQRPMSQHGRAMDIIDRESGFMGYILRPLSAARLEPTEAELNGLVDRSKLLGITGRYRKTQISPASQNGIRDYPCPAGGCLLTDKNFADKIRDYFNYTEHPSLRDIPLLKMGRHFRLDNGDKIIVARNEHESKSLKDLCRPGDHLLAPLAFLALLWFYREHPYRPLLKRWHGTPKGLFGKQTASFIGLVEKKISCA